MRCIRQATLHTPGASPGDFNLSQPPGDYTLQAVFTGAPGLGPSSLARPFTITKDSTQLQIQPGAPVRVEFRADDNPFKGRRNPLTPRQVRSRKRLMKRVKR